MSGARIDWPGLVRAGLHRLGLAPGAFWALTPVELKIMLGADQAAAPLTRARLAELAAAFPDAMKGADDGGTGKPDRAAGDAGGAAGGLGPDGDGL
ncbi:rcc01693 family protein [Pseudogemmobacter sonorensis]|uniref:rcc01693 family protein n=1 Tax=Pseudogemmobacter sonorensis TaxID=2989681 RepID=UPI003F669794